MSTLRKVIAASALAIAFGGSALASDTSEVGNPGMLLYQNGTMVTVKASTKVHTSLMQHAKPFTGGLVYASGGRLYTIENVKMAGGQMLYDLVRDPALQASER
jgi:hypothetical protein